MPRYFQRAALVGSRFAVRPQRVSAILTMTPPPNWERQLPLLRQLADDPSYLEGLVRAAMAETLLIAYRQRFLRNVGNAVAMQRETKGPLAAPIISQLTRRAYQRAIERLDEAVEARASQRTIKALEGRMARVRGRMERQLTLRQRAKKGKLGPGGVFRQMALKLLTDVSLASSIRTSTNARGVQFGVGHIPTINRLETPSATPHLTGEPTGSRFKVFWKHLEFGTGVYALNKSVNAGSPHRLPSGGWWYGQNPGNALYLKGSRGIAALRNPATKLPYQPDSLRFYKVFGTMLAQALGFSPKTGRE